MVNLILLFVPQCLHRVKASGTVSRIKPGQEADGCGKSRPPIMWRRVDFPEPEGPTMATNSPSATVKSMPERAWMVSSPMR